VCRDVIEHVKFPIPDARLHDQERGQEGSEHTPNPDSVYVLAESIYARPPPARRQMLSHRMGRLDLYAESWICEGGDTMLALEISDSEVLLGNPSWPHAWAIHMAITTGKRMIHVLTGPTRGRHY